MCHQKKRGAGRPLAGWFPCPADGRLGTHKGGRKMQLNLDLTETRGAQVRRGGRRRRSPRCASSGAGEPTGPALVRISIKTRLG